MENPLEEQEEPVSGMETVDSGNMLLYSALLIAITVVVLGVYLYMNKPSKRKRPSTVPGPEPLDAIEGNMPDIGRTGSLHGYLMELHHKYGGIVSFWMRDVYLISIATPELFRQHAKNFNRPVEWMFTVFKDWMGPDSLQFANYDDGKRRRKIYDHAYTSEAVKKYYNTFQRIADQTADKLSELPEDEHIPLSQWMFSLSIKAMAQASFGLHFDNDEAVRALQDNYNSAMDEMESRLATGRPPADSPRQIRLEEAVERLYAIIQKCIQQRHENPPDKDEELLLDLILSSAESESVVLCDCVGYLVAGLHTTGFVLTWCLFYISHNPEYQEKVVEELNKVLGKNEVVKPSHLDQLQYTRQVLDETMRCSVLGPYAARFDDDECILGGHVIPAKTPVIHALGVLGYNEELYPDPARFDPDRFSPEKVKKRPPFSFEPFGFAGKRKCPGHRFAYAELTIVLATLLRRFRFKLVPGQEIAPVFGFVTKPNAEIWMTMEPRK